MGWQDAPLVEDTAPSGGSAWMDAPLADEPTGIEPEVQRPTAYLPSGEPLTQEERRVRGKEAIRTGVEPVLMGGGAMIGATVGTLAGPAGTIGGAGLGYATGEKISDFLLGEEWKGTAEELKDFSKEVVKGAALEATGLGIAKVAAKGTQAVANSLYQSAVKTSQKLGRFDRDAVIKAGLDQKIFPSKAGLNKIDKGIRRVNIEIDRAVKKASSKGWIDRGKVAESFDRAKKLFKDDENAVAILTAIDKRKADFIKGHAPFMTAQKAQKMKIGLNKDLKNAFGEIKRDTKEGSKALRRSLRIELEKMNPALHNLNRKHRVSMLLDKEIDNAVTRIGNKEIVSLIGTVGVAGGGAYGGDPAAGLMAGLALQLITSGKTKAGLGMALNRAVKYGGGATAVRRGLGPLLIKGEENEQIAGER